MIDMLYTLQNVPKFLFMLHSLLISWIYAWGRKIGRVTDHVQTLLGVPCT